jgi:hypothetical protein
MSTFRFRPKISGVTLEAEVYYEPGEKATWEEPGCPPTFDVGRVWIEAVEIFDLLHPSVIEMIEEQAANYKGEGSSHTDP